MTKTRISLPWLLLILLTTAALSGCSSALNWNHGAYTVRPGDTLYSIAMQYDLDARQLAAWNNLGSGTYIRAGQKLRLTPGGGSGAGAGATNSTASSRSRSAPVAVPTLPAPVWLWPTEGRVTARFGKSVRAKSGIRIGGRLGQPVIATAAGEVVYAGDGLRSYGQLVIIKHNDTWLSAYGFNSRLLVAEGSNVGVGQKIAEMGEDSSDTPTLHFEIRRNGKPVDPVRYLPPRP